MLTLFALGGGDLLLNVGKLVFQLVSLKVAIESFAVGVAAFGFHALTLHRVNVRASVCGWLAVYALILKGAAVHAGVMAVPFKIAVLYFVPLLPPVFKLLPAVPLAHLFPEAVPADFAQGYENVRVVVSVVPLASGGVNVDVGNHALPHELFPHKVGHKQLALLVGQFVG